MLNEPSSKNDMQLFFKEIIIVSRPKHVKLGIGSIKNDKNDKEGLPVQAVSSLFH